MGCKQWRSQHRPELQQLSRTQAFETLRDFKRHALWIIWGEDKMGPSLTEFLLRTQSATPLNVDSDKLKWMD